MKYGIILAVLIIIGAGVFYASKNNGNTSAPASSINNQQVVQVSPSPQAVTFMLAPSSGTYKVGDVFDVQIMVDGQKYNVGAVDFELNYDKNKLAVTSFTPSKTFNQVIVNELSDTTLNAGKLRFAAGNNTLNKIEGGNILIGTIHFKAKAVGNVSASLIPRDVAVRTNPPADVPTSGATVNFAIGAQ